MKKWLKNLFKGGAYEPEEMPRHEIPTEEEKQRIEEAVKRTIDEYGEALKRLAND
ncbi:hypothetical protein HYW30_01835 [Candidatus Azambacteria bacterium]|nr:hypothetical protein [Candidatus Azambacteria bacterium]MBI2588019.1 hypothetical protein [Candidatus Azambacteria bacterium]